MTDEAKKLLTEATEALSEALDKVQKAIVVFGHTYTRRRLCYARDHLENAGQILDQILLPTDDDNP